MAYADFNFYQNIYYGEVLTSGNASRWLDRASDMLDTLTFGRLTFAFPVVEAHVIKVKKAVCAIADVLCNVDTQRKAATYREGSNGEFKGTVSSISSGRETVSYSTSNVNSSIYGKAAANENEFRSLVAETAASYIANIPDSEGVNLLYGGDV